MTAGGIVSLPFVVVLGFPASNAWPLLAGSMVTHVGYGLALSTAYERANLSVAYPIARGTAPLLVAIGGVVLLNDPLTGQGVIGIVLITLGLASLATSHVFHDVKWAVLTGLFITAYTLIDGAGVREVGHSIRYIAAAFVLHSIGMTIAVLILRDRDKVRSAVAIAPMRLLFGGAASAAAYGLVMIAARTEPLGMVSGLRETSALFGLLIGKRMLNERVTARQATAVGLAVLGAVAIATA